MDIRSKRSKLITQSTSSGRKICASGLVLPLILLLGAMSPAAAWCQSSSMPSGVAQQAQFDAQHRPITAGGYVKTGPAIFQDAAAQAGLTTWRNHTGTPEKRIIIEAKGSGVCLLDYDNDGWLDVHPVNGSGLRSEMCRPIQNCRSHLTPTCF